MLLGVAFCPETSYAVVFAFVREILLCNAANKRVFRIAVCEKRANGQKDLGDGERWRPIILQYVQADGALRVDITVVDARAERHLQRINKISSNQLLDVPSPTKTFKYKHVFITQFLLHLVF